MSCWLLKGNQRARVEPLDMRKGKGRNYGITLWSYNGEREVASAGGVICLLIGSPKHQPSSFSEYEGQNILQDLLCMSDVHSMRRLFVDFDFSLLRKVCNETRSCFNGLPGANCSTYTIDAA